MVGDLCDQVASVLHPMPIRQGVPSQVFAEDTAQVRRDREQQAARLRLDWTVRGRDPVLSALAGLAEQRRELEEKVRLLLAYARTFADPRPYTLTELADAARMSFSGVRTAYRDEHVSVVASRTGLPRPGQPAARGRPRGTGRPGGPADSGARRSPEGSGSVTAG